MAACLAVPDHDSGALHRPDRQSWPERVLITNSVTFSQRPSKLLLLGCMQVCMLQAAATPRGQKRWGSVASQIMHTHRQAAHTGTAGSPERRRVAQGWCHQVVCGPASASSQRGPIWVEGGSARPVHVSGQVSVKSGPGRLANSVGRHTCLTCYVGMACCSAMHACCRGGHQDR